VQLTRRIYVPNKASDSLDEAKKLLYLLKTAINQEKPDKILVRIDVIRALLNEVSEKLASDP
jgi:hypothetical protein